jgi:Rrf2 family transcriptional regulator, iron-sulfur cluster assembly transcription factor
MIAPPKKLHYAVEAVLYIAYNASNGPINSRDIADRQGLPPRYLEQLMQRLVRAGILRGIRGPHGGYVLAMERRRITVADICEALKEAQDDEEGLPPGTPLGNQVVTPMWEAAFGQAMQYLKQMSLAQLCEQAIAQNIRKDAEEKLDFTI